MFTALYIIHDLLSTCTQSLKLVSPNFATQTSERVREIGETIRAQRQYVDYTTSEQNKVSR